MVDFKTGDVVVMKKKIGCLNDIGDMFTVTGVSWGMVSFTSLDEKTGITVDVNTARKSFEKYVEPKKQKVEIDTRVNPELIDCLIEQSDVEVQTLFGNCTMVALRLPNGFVIAETSACVDPNNYDIEIGKAICMKKIRNKVWELEGYLLCDYLWDKSILEKDENEDEPDCENCEDYDCDLNPNR